MRQSERITLVPKGSGIVRAAVPQACAHRVQRAGAIAHGASHVEQACNAAHIRMLDPGAMLGLPLER